MDEKIHRNAIFVHNYELLTFILTLSGGNDFGGFAEYFMPTIIKQKIIPIHRK